MEGGHSEDALEADLPMVGEVWILYNRGRVWVHHLSSAEGHCRFSFLQRADPVFYCLLPARNEVGARLCFYRRLWCPQGGGVPPSVHAGRYPTEQTPPEQALPREQSPPWSIHPLPESDPSGSMLWAYGQWAGGTHPTGMQSCLLFVYVCKWMVWKKPLMQWQSAVAVGSRRLLIPEKKE